MPQKLGSYDVYGTLGKGQFSRVRFAVNRLTNASYAIKIVDKQKLKDNDGLENVKNEIAIIKTVDCKYCVGVRDMFANTEKIFLVIDLMMGGSLMQKFRKRGKFSEERARFYAQQIFLGLEYCHKMGVIVGGLSLEGILMDRDNNIKICDFGYATLETCIMPTSMGNRSRPHYLSPELVSETSPVSQASDLWSFAVIVYALAAGYMPFELCPDVPELFRKIVSGAYEPFPVWFSPEICDLLNSMLQREMAHRLSQVDARAHPWMKWDTTDFGVEEADEDDDEEDGVSKTTNGVNDRVRQVPPGMTDNPNSFACLNIIPDVFQILWTPLDMMNIPNPMGKRASADSSQPQQQSASAQQQQKRPPQSHAKKLSQKRSANGIGNATNGHGNHRADAYTYDPSEVSGVDDRSGNEDGEEN